MTGRMTVHQGDITKLEVDAIVNAANERLAPGGGVCGAIHRAAGPKLAEDCARIGHCATGDAVITPGHDLPARHVIHTVGPVWHGGDRGEPEALASCYRRSIELAAEHGCRTIAFPAVSTGIYGYPPDQAAEVAVRAVRDVLRERPEMRVTFCCFDQASAERHRAAIDRL